MQIFNIIKENKKLLLISTVSTTLLCLVVAAIYIYRYKIKVLPVCGKVTSEFGYRTHPISGEQSFHNGIDIAVAEGTEVLSPFAGEVVKIFETAAGGKQLLIKHEKAGYQTGYAHLSDYKCKLGDKVKKGRVVALSGNTGNSTGAHLHFTVTDLKTNTKINPLTIFKF